MLDKFADLSKPPGDFSDHSGHDYVLLQPCQFFFFIVQGGLVMLNLQPCRPDKVGRLPQASTQAWGKWRTSIAFLTLPLRLRSMSEKENCLLSFTANISHEHME